jgi:acyl carrier protein
MSAQLEQEIISKVKSMVSSQLGKSVEEIDLDAAFIEDLGADSLDLVELVMAMEDEFGIEISDEDAEKIVTVKDAVNYILERRSQ